jgi:hypothetical protein
MVLAVELQVKHAVKFKHKVQFGIWQVPQSLEVEL